MKKRLLTILLAAAMMFSLTPAATYAAAIEKPVEAAGNEDLPDLLVPEELPTIVGDSDESSNAVPSFSVSDKNELILKARSLMVQRVTDFVIVVDVTTSKDNYEQELKDYESDMKELLLAHTGNPVEGDYLQWHILSYGMPRYSLRSKIQTTDDSIVWEVQYYFYARYHSDPEQETQMNTAVAEAMAEMNLEGKSDYNKVIAIHDYICDHTEYKYGYSWKNFGDYIYCFETDENGQDYITAASPHSAYAGLVEGEFVCQGYASLFYRLCLEAGVEARVVTGTGDGEAHAWNIVKLDGLYYLVDVTWDDGDDVSYEYFLKGTNDFPEHSLDEEYTTDEFKAAYPISTTDYAPTYLDEYPDDTPSFVKASLLLSGYIGVNFYLKLPDKPFLDYTDSYMEFVLDDTDGTTSRDDYDPSDLSEDNKLFKFTCNINSIQMADTITAVFHYKENGEAKTIKKDYSAEQYISALVNSSDTNTDTADLANALGTYGFFAQKYLSELRGWALGTDHRALSKINAADFGSEQITSALNKIGAGLELEGSNPDIESIRFSLVLDSGTAICVYFTPAEDFNGTITASVEGTAAAAQKMPDGRYRVTIPDIGAHLLENPFTVKAETKNGAVTIRLSAMSYVRRILENETNRDAVNTMMALYNYSEAVKAYRKA